MHKLLEFINKINKIMLHSEAEIPEEKHLKLWKIVAFISIGFSLLIIILISFCLIKTESIDDINKIKNDLEKSNQENIRLNTSLTGLKLKFTEIQSQNIILQENNTKLQNLTKFQSELIKSQENHIINLKNEILTLFIGGGSSLGLGIGASLYAFYERNLINNQEKQIYELDEKNKMLGNYMNKSYIQLISNELNSIQNGYFSWEIIYNSSVSWDKNDLVKNLSNQGNTTAIIMTEKNWIIVGNLQEPWDSTGNYVTDLNAFTMSINRVLNCKIENSQNAQKAARLGFTKEIFLEFGDGEILIFSNKTGRAIQGKTYKNYENIKNETFYAGEYEFLVKFILVFKHIWISK